MTPKNSWHERNGRSRIRLLFSHLNTEEGEGCPQYHPQDTTQKPQSAIPPHLIHPGSPQGCHYERHRKRGAKESHVLSAAFYRTPLSNKTFEQGCRQHFPKRPHQYRHSNWP